MPLPVFRRLLPLAHSLASLPLPAFTAMALAAAGVGGAQAATPAPAPVEAARTNSAMDGQLFYQLFMSELELARGEPGVAYQVVLDAAKRTRDDALFQRAIDIAVSARAGDQALLAARAWRSATPRSRRAAEMQAQLLMALTRPAEANEPLRAMLEFTPEAERPSTIAMLPRMVIAGQGKPAAATVIDEVLKPWRANPTTRSSAIVATARSWAIAGESGKAMDGVRDIQTFEPESEGAALLALELFGKEPDAEKAVLRYLDKQPAGHEVRLAYARRLTSVQRFQEALDNTQRVTRADPKIANAWMLEGALQIELSQPQAAQTALKRYLQVTQDQETAARKAALDKSDNETDPGDEATPSGAEERAQAYLMLAQSSEQLKDYAGAQAWLDQLGDAQSSPVVISRRAGLLARQGKVKEARALLQSLPERNTDEARSKVLAETQLLRDQRLWKEAHDVLERANARLPDDADLLYEQALLAERLTRFDEMEKLLRRVMTLKPDLQHAYNALGYSLADRSLRLDEARQLVQKALELAPGDPFILDSMGWVEFRQGRRDAALALLKQAYGQRPDTEIGAHLGEVLWSLGQQDEARRIWRAGMERDATNDVLKETLNRLKVRL